MDQTSMNDAATNEKVRLETIVPSAIKVPSKDGVSCSAFSTLKSSQSKRLSMVDSSPPDGWTRIKHPDSGIYYVNVEKGVCTTSNVFDPKTCSLITEGAEILRGSLASQAPLEDKDVGLVLYVSPNKPGTKPSYYCVSHVERRVFWLDDIGHGEVEIPCKSDKCTQSAGSTVHCIEAQYWKHCELFPTSFTVTKDVTGDLKDILLQAAADRLLVKFSTSPHDKHDLEYMLNLVKEIEADVEKSSSHAAWIIARFMALHNDGVLQSSYGQTDDYFDIEDTKKIGDYKRPILLAILAPPFLRTPDVFAVELHSLHQSFSLERWSSFVHKVDQSIRDSNLLATVLLSTNVGLLAWSDGGRKGELNKPTAAQIVTYISIICTVGSIIIGLAIFKQYRAKGADTPLRAVVVLRRILKEPFGLERLAIICSLPYVLLLWGLIAFQVAFCIIFYEETGIQVRIPVTLALSFVVLCLLFCWHTAGAPGKEDQDSQKGSRKESYLGSKSHLRSENHRMEVGLASPAPPAPPPSPPSLASLASSPL